MLLNSYVDPVFGVKTLVSLGRASIIVNVDGLSEATFLLNDARARIDRCKCHLTMATLLDFANECTWRLPQGLETISEKMTISLAGAGFPALGQLIKPLIAEHKPTVDSLSTLWRKVIEPRLHQRAGAAGYTSSRKQTLAVEEAIREAHPLRHSTLLHPRAIHFIDQAWPNIYYRLKDQVTEYHRAIS